MLHGFLASFQPRAPAEPSPPPQFRPSGLLGLRPLGGRGLPRARADAAHGRARGQEQRMHPERALQDRGAARSSELGARSSGRDFSRRPKERWQTRRALKHLPHGSSRARVDLYYADGGFHHETRRFVPQESMLQILMLIGGSSGTMP